MLSSLDHTLSILEHWLPGIAGPALRPFGRRTARYQGFSDGVEGVQWNAGVDRARSVATVGVNLEGMKYQDWPSVDTQIRPLNDTPKPAIS